MLAIIYMLVSEHRYYLLLCIDHSIIHMLPMFLWLPSLVFMPFVTEVGCWGGSNWWQLPQYIIYLSSIFLPCLYDRPHWFMITFHFGTPSEHPFLSDACFYAKKNPALMYWPDQGIKLTSLPPSQHLNVCGELYTSVESLVRWHINL